MGTVVQGLTKEQLKLIEVGWIFATNYISADVYRERLAKWYEDMKKKEKGAYTYE